MAFPKKHEDLLFETIPEGTKIEMFENFCTRVVNEQTINRMCIKYKVKREVFNFYRLSESWDFKRQTKIINGYYESRDKIPKVIRKLPDFEEEVYEEGVKTTYWNLISLADDLTNSINFYISGKSRFDREGKIITTILNPKEIAFLSQALRSLLEVNQNSSILYKRLRDITRNKILSEMTDKEIKEYIQNLEALNYEQTNPGKHRKRQIRKR